MQTTRKLTAARALETNCVARALALRTPALFQSQIDFMGAASLAEELCSHGLVQKETLKVSVTEYNGELHLYRPGDCFTVEDATDITTRAAERARSAKIRRINAYTGTPRLYRAAREMADNAGFPNVPGDRFLLAEFWVKQIPYFRELFRFPPRKDKPAHRMPGGAFYFPGNELTCYVVVVDASFTPALLLALADYVKLINDERVAGGGKPAALLLV